MRHSSDDSVLSDIESHMFKYSDRTADVPKNEISVDPDKPRSLFVELVLKRTRNLKYNVAMAFLSGLKIIATLTAMVESPKSCPDILNIWLIVLAVYDLINVISRFMLIKILIPKRNSNLPIEGLVTGSRKDEDPETLNRRKVTLINEFQFPFQFHEQKENKAIQVIALSRFFYIGLFVWSQFILYRHLHSSCDFRILNFRTSLFYVYLGFGYIYVGVPILLFVFDCFVACCCGIRNRFRSSRTRARSDVEKIIIYRKYTVGLSGLHKCGICTKEYLEEDNLIQLQCNIDHHFHERCLTNFMDKDRFCPLCGRKFSYSRDDTMNTSQQRRSIANLFL